MTEEEILKLSDDGLTDKVAELFCIKRGLWVSDTESCLTWIVDGRKWDPVNDIAAAMDLFNEVYNPMSKIRGGAWVLSTVDEGKDCSLATLFFGAPSRRARRQGRKNRPLKARAKAKKKQMARAITLCYVMALEGATVDLRYQVEEA